MLAAFHMAVGQNTSPSPVKIQSSAFEPRMMSSPFPPDVTPNQKASALGLERDQVVATPAVHIVFIGGEDEIVAGTAIKSVFDVKPNGS